MISKNYLAAFLAVPLALAGCSSSDDPGPTSANVAHTADDTLNKLLNSPDKTATFTANPRFLSRQFEREKTTTGTASNEENTTSVTVSFDKSKDTLTLKVGDDEIIFDTTDGLEANDKTSKGYRKKSETSGLTYHVIFESDDLDDIKDADGEPQSQFHATLIIIEESATYFNRGYMTIGFTPDREALQAKTTATYEGNFSSTLYNVEDSIKDTGRYILNGDMTLEANFDSGKVSGAVTGLTQRIGGGAQPETALEDKLLLKEASIKGAFFESSFEHDCTGNCALEIGSSVVKGGFYGDKAQEAGGNFELKLKNDGKDYEGGGYFRANETTTEADGS